MICTLGGSSGKLADIDEDGGGNAESLLPPWGCVVSKCGAWRFISFVFLWVSMQSKRSSGAGLHKGWDVYFFFAKNVGVGAAFCCAVSRCLEIVV